MAFLADVKKSCLPLMSALATTAIAAPPVPIHLMEATLAGQHVRLLEVEGRCAIGRAGKTPLPLDMKWPCHFSINNQKQPRVEIYNDTPILMVERSVPLPAPSQDCRTDRQAVRWYQGRLEAARAQHIAMCGPAHWDQKAFFASFKW